MPLEVLDFKRSACAADAIMCVHVYVVLDFKKSVCAGDVIMRVYMYIYVRVQAVVSRFSSERLSLGSVSLYAQAVGSGRNSHRG